MFSPTEQDRVLKEFLARHVHPYDPETDDYDCKQFAADIKEGKNDVNARVDYFGVGIDLRTESPRPADIRRGAERILNEPQWKKNVVRLQKEFSGYNPNELIDAYLGAGTVLVNNKPAHQARLDRDYGIVFQAPVLFDWRSVQSNVELPLEIMKVNKEERAHRAQHMLDLVELGGFTRHYPWQLSGGMQQRVSIARALSFNPALLLMDEPFGALDEITRERMNAELLNIWARTKKTIVFVTHSIPEAVFLSTRVVVMSPRPGRITKIIPINLPQPRAFETRELPKYFEMITAVREALRGNEAAAQVAGP